MRVRISPKLKRRLGVFVIVVFAFFILGRPIVGISLSNLAMVISLGELLPEDNAEFDKTAGLPASFFLGSTERRKFDRSERLLKLALAINPGESGNYRRLALMALLKGDFDRATTYLSIVSDEFSENQIVYYYQVSAWDKQERYADIIEAYENVLPRSQPQEIKDAIAIAYIELYGSSSAANVHDLRPYDLYANYALWMDARERGSIVDEHYYESLLVYFTEAAVLPRDPRLFARVTETVPYLLQHGIWDRETTLNVVSSFVWQRYKEDSVLDMLAELSEVDPFDPDWLYYRAELYYRRGALLEAKNYYLEVLKHEPGYGAAHIKLGMLAMDAMRSRPKDRDGFVEAFIHLSEYTQMRPDDLLGWKQLADLCLLTAQPGDIDPCQELRDVSLSDVDVLARLLGVPSGALELGHNLVRSGEFEDWNPEGPADWKWTTVSALPLFQQRLFVSGSDSFAAIGGNNTARIDGLRPLAEPSQRTSSGGFTTWDVEVDRPYVFQLEPGQPYLLSFYYRTDNLGKVGAGVWLTAKNERAPFWTTGEYGLPRTEGAWYLFYAIGINTDSTDFAVAPRFRSFTTGTIQLDSFALRAIIISEPYQPQLEEGVRIVTGDDFSWLGEN